MAFPELRSAFTGKAAALALVGALSLTAAPNAAKARDVDCAQFDGMTSHSTFVKGDDMMAVTGVSEDWSECNKDGMSMTIYMGTHEKTPSMERIEQRLSEDIKGAGVSKYAFFFAQNDVLGTGASIQRKGKTVALHPLGKIRPEASKIAKLAAFENKILDGQVSVDGAALTLQ